MENKISIRQWGGGNILLLVLGFLFTAGAITVSFLILFVEDNTIGFVLTILFALVIAYFFIFKPLAYKISFVDNRIIVPKRTMQKDRLELDCDKINSFDLWLGDFTNFYIIFDYADSKKKKFNVTLFSKKQLSQILSIIKERGGLRKQRTDTDEIISQFLFGKKKNKKSVKSL